MNMGILNYFLCIGLVHLARGYDVKLFFGSSEKGKLDISCCLEHFERLPVNLSTGQCSVVLLLPDQMSSYQIDSVYMEETRRVGLCSVQIWQARKYLLIQRGYTSTPLNNKYIIFEESPVKDAQTVAMLSNNRSDFDTLSRVCIVRNMSRVGPFHRNRADPGCSLMTSNAVPVLKRSSDALRVAGTASRPSVYFDAKNGSLKGVEVSLIKTIAEKLQLPLLVNVIDSSKGQPSDRFPVDR